MSLEKKVRVQVGGEVRGDELGVLTTGLLSLLLFFVSTRPLKRTVLKQKQKQMEEKTHDDSAFTPPSIPMSADVTDPVALTPNARADGDFGVKLNAHLKVSLKSGFGDGIGAGGGRIALETIDHSIKIAFLVWGLDRWCRDWSSVNSFVQDWIVGVVFFHRAEIVWTFE